MSGSTEAPVRVCDAHCDTLCSVLTSPDRSNDVTLERLKAGGVSVQTMAMYVGAAADIDTIARRFDGMLQIFERLKEEGWHQPVSYTHLRAHENTEHLVCLLLLEKKKTHVNYCN